MTGDLYWASANFQIAATIELPYQVRIVAIGDFSGAGSAVLRGALARVAGLPVPIHVDASGITALSGDAAAALAERTGDPARPLTVVSASSAAVPVLDTAHIHVTPPPGHTRRGAQPSPPAGPPSQGGALALIAGAARPSRGCWPAPRQG